MRISKEFKIGLFSIVSIALLYLGFNFLKGIDFFSSTDTYYVIYENIDGLQVSNPVIIHGFRVGRVSQIKFLQGNENKIIVTLDIEGDIVLDDSTKAILISEGFLGGKAIELRIPDQIRQPLQNEDTISSEVAMGLIESLTEQTAPVANDVGALIRKFNTMMDSLMLTESLVRKMINKVNQTLDVTRYTVSTNQKNLSATIENMKLLSGELTQSSSKLDTLLGKTNIFVDSLNSLELSRTMEKLNTISENLSTLIKGLKNGEGTAGKLLTNDSLYVNLDRAAESLNKLLTDLKEHPKRYVHFSLFGGKGK